MQDASKKIPNERKNRAHVLLAATAGMRLLRFNLKKIFVLIKLLIGTFSSSNETQSQNILGYIRDHFYKSEFLYKSDNQVRILTGKEEGLFGWITANYFADKFSPVIKSNFVYKPKIYIFLSRKQILCQLLVYLTWAAHLLKSHLFLPPKVKY